MDIIVKILSRFVLRDLIPEIIKYTTPAMGRMTNKRSEKAPIPVNGMISIRPAGKASLFPGTSTVRKKKATKIFNIR
jgi:hypothetical protein